GMPHLGDWRAAAEAARLAVSQWLTARGDGLAETVKSAELSSVLWPSGSRTSLFPGLGAAGGAGAGCPRTNAVVAAPWPRRPTVEPFAARRGGPPPGAAPDAATG